eukprot:TRINITY_DN1775_c0_g2_i2.p1 TRINITY_DN1775_c0_g2~~TRINITY_DN1775_c0_g2_i2.p1  ORF type:complete len:617 (+),score=215.89 TRINITY_DN1775_c0_g2_i2:115-1851(+)
MAARRTTVAASGSPEHQQLLERLKGRWVNRDQLDEWLKTMETQAYQRRVRGVAVRFLAADMGYRVGWVNSFESKNIRPDGVDCLIVDAGHGPNEVVLLRNVSNSSFKAEEVHPDVLKLLTPSTAEEAAAQIKDQSLLPDKEDALTFWPQVLMIQYDGTPRGPEPISEVVSRATAVDPDTPVAGGAGGGGFGQQLDIPEDCAMLSHQGTNTAAIMAVLEERSRVSAGDEQPVRAFLDMTVNLSETGGARGGGVSKPYYIQQLLSMCKRVKEILLQERMLLRLRSPLYVFGDLHGNFFDLHYFLDRLIAFGEIKCSAASFLFLGDYVDRGDNGVEVAAYLMGLKILAPKKVFMLRGNHESPEVNGDLAQYGEMSFRHECHRKFGESKGEDVWKAFNDVFSVLPAAAVIDGKVFAAHGGIPRFDGGTDDRLKLLDSPHFPRLDRIMQPPGFSEPDLQAKCRQMMIDLVWSDPADPDTVLDQHGFGANPRGGGLRSFGHRAVDIFCKNHGFSHVFRAHQEKANGLRISDDARVVTIFSTSDYVGHQNGAGVIYVGDSTIRMIIKEPPPVEDDAPAMELPGKK